MKAASRRSTVSVTGSEASADLRGTLHELRSKLARLKGEIELAVEDQQPVRSEVLSAVNDVVVALEAVENAAFERVAPPSGARSELVDERASVFIVDDDLRLSELLARQLSRFGLHASARADLFEVMNEIGSEDVLVVDLGLAQELDPLTQDWLRSHRPVVISGAASRDAEAAAAQIGASGFLVKPFEPAELVRALKTRREAARP